MVQDDGVFVMEYADFLEHWEGIECTQLFDDTWVQSSHWLNVHSRPLPSAWQFGDVSCTRILILLLFLVLTKILSCRYVQRAEPNRRDHRTLAV